MKGIRRLRGLLPKSLQTSRHMLISFRIIFTKPTLTLVVKMNLILRGKTEARSLPGISKVSVKTLQFKKINLKNLKRYFSLSTLRSIDSKISQKSLISIYPKMKILKAFLKLYASKFRTTGCCRHINMAYYMLS